VNGIVRAGAETESLAAHDAGEPIAVLLVDDEPHYFALLEQHFGDADRIELRHERSPSAAARQLPDVDCVVSEYAMPERDGVELLAEVREFDPTLPFVLFTCASRDELAEPLLSTAWTEYLQKQGTSETIALLGRRIRHLVDHRRAVTLARRTLSAVELSREGTAITDPDGAFDVVNRAFAASFGYDREALLGREWTTLFPDDEVERLRSTALPTTKEGWQWTGRCNGRRADGERFTVRPAIARLEDGTLAFTVRDEQEARG